MTCSVCSRSFGPRAKVLLLDGKLLHPRCEHRGEKKQAAKRERFAGARAAREERRPIPDSMLARVASIDKGVCRSCGFDVARIDAWIRKFVFASQIRQAPVYGTRDRHTEAVVDGAVLGLHRARALVLLGRLWGVVLTWGCHFSEVDHIQPVAEGGTNDLSNLQTICRKCHVRKTAEQAVRQARRPSKGVGYGFNT